MTAQQLTTCHALAEVPVYSFEGDNWSGTIPALEYGGFLPVGSAKMLAGYDGPNYGLARHDDEGGEYGKPIFSFRSLKSVVAEPCTVNAPRTIGLLYICCHLLQRPCSCFLEHLMEFLAT